MLNHPIVHLVYLVELWINLRCILGAAQMWDHVWMSKWLIWPSDAEVGIGVRNDPWRLMHKNITTLSNGRIIFAVGGTLSSLHVR